MTPEQQELSGRHLADLLTAATPEERADYERWAKSRGALPVLVSRADALATGTKAPIVGETRALFRAG